MWKIQRSTPPIVIRRIQRCPQKENMLSDQEKELRFSDVWSTYAGRDLRAEAYSDPSRVSLSLALPSTPKKGKLKNHQGALVPCKVSKAQAKVFNPREPCYCFSNESQGSFD